jgi:hypothetical protein
MSAADNGATTAVFATYRLEIFALRAAEIADRVAAGRLGFIDGVDMAYSAAQWAGLVDDVGEDIVQSILAAAFASARPVP